MAFLTKTSSDRTPALFIFWSNCHKYCSRAGIGNLLSFLFISFSTITSCLLYSINSFQRSGSCLGKFLVRPSLAFVGLHGLEKKFISCVPAESFCSSIFKDFATLAKEPGNPKIIEWIIVHCH